VLPWIGVYGYAEPSPTEDVVIVITDCLILADAQLCKQSRIEEGINALDVSTKLLHMTFKVSDV
jgi:hypothetical protein